MTKNAQKEGILCFALVLDDLNSSIGKPGVTNGKRQRTIGHEWQTSKNDRSCSRAWALVRSHERRVRAVASVSWTVVKVEINVSIGALAIKGALRVVVLPTLEKSWRQ
jgi:hypothetical protein